MVEAFWQSHGASEFQGNVNLLRQLQTATNEKNTEIKEQNDGKSDLNRVVYAVPVTNFKDLVERNKAIISNSAELASKELEQSQ